MKEYILDAATCRMNNDDGPVWGLVAGVPVTWRMYSEKGVLYYRSAATTRGRSGYEYAVVPRGWKQVLRIEDL